MRLLETNSEGPVPCPQQGANRSWLRILAKELPQQMFDFILEYWFSSLS